MAATQNPMQTGTPPPSVSKATLHMSGLLCDVYGLDELINQRPTAISCLWLHHPRLRAKEDMADFASRIVSQQQQRGATGGRALIAVAFDQRNHGSRLVAPKANESWREGNGTHALDMWGMVSGMVSDTRGLIDVVEGYVKLELAGRGVDGAAWKIDQHLVLGVSLGGHSAWQTLFRDERVEAGVVAIGCPDYAGLLADRAKKSRLASFDVKDGGASFLGGRDFPADLVAACLREDPKGMLFGTGPVPMKGSLDDGEKGRLRGVLDGLRITGKRFLVCSGAEDKLVPYAASEAFVEVLREAAGTWYADAALVVENRVYEGVGHEFSAGMVEDACRFLLDAVSAADGRGKEGKARI
ncbi:hypothetical protein CCHL11_06412 [Colletotrichum chlorophyti]|uniref:Uncharacterized protein n=1 Tax=Colletotrichum chlorophyti TaxID=708187 RepID=A0A1Q8RQK0_9PEZI|nr:hypothetical protein CCHL11_06412 [Colletotrichum chlorophyti]